MAPGVFDIAGCTALVTGSSRGIGRSLALGLVEAGCSVAVHGRDRGTLEETVAGLAGVAAAAGARVQPVAFDVTDADAVEAGVTEVETRLGPLDILVNNAGVQHRSPLLDFPDDAWRRVLETNLTSAFLVGRAVARGMVARGRGKIVNVASLQSELARAGTAPYAASKGGLKMLTRGMCAEWGPSGVQVNAIGPGYFKTELTSALVADPEFDAWVRGRTPAGRWGSTEELVGALLFLASPASDYVCGQLIAVDGGMSAVV
jgi:gluconate 5-dehydrogenase